MKATKHFILRTIAVASMVLAGAQASAGEVYSEPFDIAPGTFGTNPFLSPSQSGFTSLEWFATIGVGTWSVDRVVLLEDSEFLELRFDLSQPLDNVYFTWVQETCCGNGVNFSFDGTFVKTINATGPDSYTAGDLTAGHVYALRWDVNAGTSQYFFDNFKMYGDPTLAVPEPETYAMLLAGLGVVGFLGKRKAAALKAQA